MKKDPQDGIRNAGFSVDRRDHAETGPGRWHFRG
jgi:hypothetical protein